MNGLRAIILALFLFAPLPSAADQNDPRLNALFAELQAAGSEGAAATVEREIWDIWLETADKDVEALMLTGIAEMRRGAHHAALVTFDEVVNVAPNFAEGWNKRATVHFLLGNFGESLEDIEKTLELEPRHFGALSGRGLVLVGMEDLESALDAFEEALAVHPQMSGPKSNAAVIRELLGQEDI